jgi:hypothetical protein
MSTPYTLGINTTRKFIAYALLKRSATKPGRMIVKTDCLPIDGVRPTELVRRLCGIFDSLKAEFGDFEVAIRQCSAGRFGSSLQAIKSEALVEYSCDKRHLRFKLAHPSGFRAMLKCKEDQKWQLRANELFNGNGRIKNFDDGIDGAAAAAYKLVRE